MDFEVQYVLRRRNELLERWKSPYSDGELMAEIRWAWRGREGEDLPADAVESRAEAPSESLFREYPARVWQAEGTDYSFTDDAEKRYVSDKDGNLVGLKMFLLFMEEGMWMEKCSIKCKKTKFCLHNRAKCG